MLAGVDLAETEKAKVGLEALLAAEALPSLKEMEEALAAAFFVCMRKDQSDAFSAQPHAHPSACQGASTEAHVPCTLPKLSPPSPRHSAYS